jgi:hypothetical protein
MGDPVANSDLYIERSAVTFASNLRAKVLIMHGLNDPLCPPIHVAPEEFDPILLHRRLKCTIAAPHLR